MLTVPRSGIALHAVVCARSGLLVGEDMLARLAPFGFVLLWSSSFVAARVGLRHLSPLLFVAIRLSGCAVVLVLAMLLLRRSWRPLGGARWLHCAIAGALVNAVGLMAPHVGLALVAAAPLALVQSLTPLLTAVLGVFVLNERLQPGQWLGLVLGMAGVALVVGLAAAESTARLDGLLLGGAGVLGLVSGTLYFGRYCRGIALLPSVTAQFLSAALVSVLGMLLLEAPHADWTAGTIAAVAWNTVAVSLSGMALYFFLLARGSAARTTANFYLVPGTVAVLGWVLLDEHLSPLAVLGFVVAGLGCWLVGRRQRAGV
ncbi:MAG TPA: DMT family transporter [Acetobacteraceae bacterium]|nr:DMT family transporter [Acetobacteraceae bacterium]